MMESRQTPRGEAFSIMFDRPPANTPRGGVVGKTPRGHNHLAEKSTPKREASFKFLKKDEGRKASTHNLTSQHHTDISGGGGSNSSLQWTDSSRALRTAIAKDMTQREHKDPFADVVVAVPSRPPPSAALDNDTEQGVSTSPLDGAHSTSTKNDGGGSGASAKGKRPAAAASAKKSRPAWDGTTDYEGGATTTNNRDADNGRGAPPRGLRRGNNNAKAIDGENNGERDSEENDAYDDDDNDNGSEVYASYGSRRDLMTTIKPTQKGANRIPIQQQQSRRPYDDDEEGDDDTFYDDNEGEPSRYAERGHATSRVKFSYSKKLSGENFENDIDEGEEDDYDRAGRRGATHDVDGRGTYRNSNSTNTKKPSASSELYESQYTYSTREAARNFFGNRKAPANTNIQRSPSDEDTFDAEEEDTRRHGRGGGSTATKGPASGTRPANRVLDGDVAPSASNTAARQRLDAPRGRGNPKGLGYGGGAAGASEDEDEDEKEDYYAAQRRRNAAARSGQNVQQKPNNTTNDGGSRKTINNTNITNNKGGGVGLNRGGRPAQGDNTENGEYDNDILDSDRWPDSRQGGGVAVQKKGSPSSPLTPSASAAAEAEAALVASLEEERRECEAAKREYVALKQQLEKDRERLIRRRQEDEERLRREREDIEAIIEEEKAEARRDLKTAEDRIKSLRSTLQSEKDMCRKLKDENSALREQVDGLSTQQRERERLHKGEVDRLKVEIAQLFARNQELTEMAKKSQTDLLRKNALVSSSRLESEGRGDVNKSSGGGRGAGGRNFDDRGDDKKGRQQSEKRDHEEEEEEEYPEEDEYEENEDHNNNNNNNDNNNDSQADDYRRDARFSRSDEGGNLPPKSNNKLSASASAEEERRKQELRERRAREVEERFAREEKERETRKQLAIKQRAEKQRQDEERLAAERARVKAELEEERRRKQKEEEERKEKLAAAKAAAAKANESLANGSMTSKIAGASSSSAGSATARSSAQAIAKNSQPNPQVQGQKKSGSSYRPPTKMPSKAPTAEELVADDEPMPPLDIQSDDVVSHRTVGADNNKTETIYRSGKREIIYSNGTRKVELSSGHVVLCFTNGDIKQTWPSGKTTYWYESAQTMHTQLSDGSEVFEFHASQQVERHHPDGTKEILYPEGIYKLMWADGREETMIPPEAQ